VPEFITGKVRKNSYDFSRKAINDEEIQVSFFSATSFYKYK
jgi:hypothetical protein